MSMRYQIISPTSPVCTSFLSNYFSGQTCYLKHLMYRGRIWHDIGHKTRGQKLKFCLDYELAKDTIYLALIERLFWWKPTAASRLHIHLPGQSNRFNGVYSTGEFIVWLMCSGDRPYGSNHMYFGTTYWYVNADCLCQSITWLRKRCYLRCQIKHFQLNVSKVIAA